MAYLVTRSLIVSVIASVVIDGCDGWQYPGPHQRLRRTKETAAFTRRTELEKAVDLWLEDREQALHEYGTITFWNVSEIRDLSRMFLNATNFDDDLSGWDVSNCVNFSSMFDSAIQFNGDISNWRLDSGVDMSNMMRRAESFNGNVSTWFEPKPIALSATESLTIRYAQSMESMFEDCYSFEGTGLKSWSTSAVTDMKRMFRNNVNLGDNLGGSWNVRIVSDFSEMFLNSSNFSQQLCWDIHQTANTTAMFNGSYGYISCEGIHKDLPQRVGTTRDVDQTSAGSGCFKCLLTVSTVFFTLLCLILS